MLNVKTADDLRKLLSQDRVLIIITGMPGSGKSTLAKKLEKHFPLVRYSLDEFKVPMYEKYGFDNDMDRAQLKHKAIDKMQMCILNCCDLGLSMVVEYCFTKDWQDFFDRVATEYKYIVVVVNCISRTLESTIDTVADRYTVNTEGRPICLQAESYHVTHGYTSRWPGLLAYTQKATENFKSGKFVSISGDYVLDDSFVNAVFQMEHIQEANYALDLINEEFTREEQLEVLRNNKWLRKLYLALIQIVPEGSLFVCKPYPYDNGIATLCTTYLQLEVLEKIATTVMPGFFISDEGMVNFQVCIFTCEADEDDIPLSEIFPDITSPLSVLEEGL